MREITFRAWTGKEMFDIDCLALTPSAWDTSGRGVSLAYQPNIKVMQYTGLKDKNGIEIYEGDILKFEHKEGYAYQSQAVSMKKWSWSTDEYAFYEMVERKYIFEVVGNIYENPELLEI